MTYSTHPHDYLEIVTIMILSNGYSVERADEPSNIKWENQDTGRCEALFRFLMVYCVVIICMVVTYIFIIASNVLSYSVFFVTVFSFPDNSSGFRLKLAPPARAGPLNQQLSTFSALLKRIATALASPFKKSCNHQTSSTHVVHISKQEAFKSE